MDDKIIDDLAYDISLGLIRYLVQDETHWVIKNAITKYIDYKLAEQEKAEG